MYDYIQVKHFTIPVYINYFLYLLINVSETWHIIDAYLNLKMYWLYIIHFSNNSLTKLACQMEEK